MEVMMLEVGEFIVVRGVNFIINWKIVIGGF